MSRRMSNSTSGMIFMIPAFAYVAWSSLLSSRITRLTGTRSI